MPIAVQVPEMLRAYCGDRSELLVNGPTLLDALAELKQKHPEMYRSICDETDAMRPHIHLFVNSDLVDPSNLENAQRRLTSKDTLTIWTAVSGG